MRFLALIFIFSLSACSTHVPDMTPEPTLQKFDLRDLEGDGIIAARDHCKDSYAGALVNNNGCGTERIETVRRELQVNFDPDSYVVKEEYFAEIAKLAEFMTQYPQVNVIIEGHTSIRGSAVHNQVLSKNRAEAIKNILIRQYDIKHERIGVVGFGFEKLLDTGNDEASHARNRRIVAELSIDQAHIDMKWNIYSVDEKTK